VRCALAVALALSGCALSPDGSGGADLGAGDAGLAPGGPPGWLDQQGARLDPLPTQMPGLHVGQFQSGEVCSQCHSVAAGNPALRDASGRDVSPVGYRATMMALAARDPFYLAAFSHELARLPGAAAAVEATCTRCHAPAADAQLRMSGSHVTFDALTRDATMPEAALARDGVGCVLCHQILPTGLGTPASFGGAFMLGSTTIYGPYQAPLVAPMQFFVSYTPAYGAHTQDSALCATCHTVITKALDDAGNAIGPPFYEQAAYLEWQNSGYPGRYGCQDCHLPSIDDDGALITTPIARPPGDVVSPRTPFSRHIFAGANGYVLRLLADNVAWSGSSTPPDELNAQADRADGSRAVQPPCRSSARCARDRRWWSTSRSTTRPATSCPPATRRAARSCTSPSRMARARSCSSRARPTSTGAWSTAAAA
jgi:hypothetical protein